jgi:hypothetical protein
MPNPKDIGAAFLESLFARVLGGDLHVPTPKDKFLTLCYPGIPVRPEDFEFCTKGLGGGVDAAEDKRLLQQAYNLAAIVDYIPDPKGIYSSEKQATVFRSSQARLSTLFGEILRVSKVLDQKLSKEDIAKIERLRAKLRTKKKIKNLITEEEQEVTEDSAVQKLYNEKLEAYLTAALLYNSKRTAAQAAIGPEGKAAVSDWANNAQLYRMQVKAAFDRWVSGGYKNEVEQINAFINQKTQRSLMLWKQMLQEYFRDATVAGLGPGQEFHYTSLVPGNFATSGGWTNYKLTQTEVDYWRRQSSTKWGAGGGLNFGFFRVGAQANGETDKYSDNLNVSDFSIEFSLAQVLISRPWFFPEFFTNRGWTLRKGEGWTFDDMPSDGNLASADGPKGNCVGYPTAILFAKDIKIRSAELSKAYSAYRSGFSAGVSIGWGPFSLSGSYSRSDSGANFNSDIKGETIEAPGMQILGFVNHLFGKAPNPLPEYKDADFE